MMWRLAQLVVLTLIAGGTGFAQGANPTDGSKVNFAESAKTVRVWLAKLVQANTTNPPGNEAKAVEFIAKRLKAASIPYAISELAPGRQNIVARLKGTGELKPVMILAHLDVVGADGQAWTVPAHEVTEKDGYLYGRGVFDDLGMAAIAIETLIQIKNTKVPHKRDFIVALTGDEESGGLGIQYLLEKYPEQVDAEIAFNEGGGIALDDKGKPRFAQLNVAEKIYQDFELSVTGTTGHSSVPRKDNAIYHLARALSRLSELKPIYRLIDVTREYFAQRANLEIGPLQSAMQAISKSKKSLPAGALKQLAEQPEYLPQLTTTCVATLIAGGTRVNALPADARANMNCRILPDETVDQVKQRLAQAINDPEIKIEASIEFSHAGASSLSGAGPTALRKVLRDLYPGLPLIPSMTLGATDSRFLRAKGIAAYGIYPIAMSESDRMRAHGIDERIGATALAPALEFTYRLLSEIGQN